MVFKVSVPKPDLSNVLKWSASAGKNQGFNDFMEKALDHNRELEVKYTKALSDYKEQSVIAKNADKKSKTNSLKSAKSKKMKAEAYRKLLEKDRLRIHNLVEKSKKNG